MNKEDYKEIMQFQRLLKVLTDKDYISLISYNNVSIELIENMRINYEQGDPLDKCY